MSKHTPGKWIAEDWRKDGDWRSTGIIWARDEFESAPGRKVCEVSTECIYADSPKEKLEEFEANTRLIAAAPEMLEALKQCYSDLQRFAPNSAGSIKSREILKKVEGA